MAHPHIHDGEIRIVGHRWSRQAHELKAFLARSRVGYRWLDIERDREAAGYLGETRDGRETLPIVILPDGTRLARPAVRDLAERIGLDTEPDQPFYDLLIVGGGPAGLSAAVYAASEGIRTIVVEQEVPGGQAGYSAKIENYPGFPEGLSGRDFAQRTVAQAERFGVEILSTRHVESLAVKGRYREICLDDETTVAAHAVLLTTGVAFRWLEAPGCPDLVGRGVYYGAATAEASDCRDQRLYVLGGGNSAGQAAVLLAEYARRVTIVAPEPSLEDTMSQYLLERIGEIPNIETCPGHTVVGRRRPEAPGAAGTAAHRRERSSEGRGRRAIRLHRRGASHPVAGRGGGPGRAGLHPGQRADGDVRARGVRGRRRARGIGQADRVGGGRGSHGGAVHPRLPRRPLSRRQGAADFFSTAGTSMR